MWKTSKHTEGNSAESFNEWNSRILRFFPSFSASPNLALASTSAGPLLVVAMGWLVLGDCGRAQTPNQQAVTSALNDVIAKDPNSALAQAFSTTGGGIFSRGGTVPDPTKYTPTNLDLLSPEALSSVYNMEFSLASLQGVDLQQRLSDVRSSSGEAGSFSLMTPEPSTSAGLAGPSGPDGKNAQFASTAPAPANRWSFFAEGQGDFTKVDSTTQALGYGVTTGGLMLGVDNLIYPNFALGFMGGYARSGVALPQGGYMSADQGSVGLYGTGFDGGFYTNFAITGGPSDYSSRRASVGGNAIGETSGYEFMSLFGTGYDWHVGDLTVGPTAAFQYSYDKLNSFTESGSLAPLAFPSQHAESTVSQVGAKASYEFKVGGFRITPELRTQWQHEFGTTDYAIESNFANIPSSSFTVHGPDIGRDSFLLGTGLTFQLTETLSLFAFYDGELARTNYLSNNVTLGLRWAF